MKEDKVKLPTEIALRPKIKLPPLREYAISLRGKVSLEVAAEMIFKYAEFLFLPIELKRLVPCKDGVPLEEPDYYAKYIDKSIPRTGREPDDWEPSCKEYERAMEDVWFEGWEVGYTGISTMVLDNKDKSVTFLQFSQSFRDYKTIEDLQKLGVFLTAEGRKIAGV